MRRVILYAKPGCGLCDDVRADLDVLAGEAEFNLVEIDITTNPALFDRFRYLIPVVDVGGGELLTPPLSIRRLRDAITAASDSNG
ncbi:MAG: glutaredoxin family protein [Caldilineales bacterium]